MEETYLKLEEKIENNDWNTRLTEEEALDQMTELNNELINTHRALIKQNEEIKYLNQQLSSANEDLKEFSYAISHDIKEPLRMVVNFMSMLKKKYNDSLDSKAQIYITTALDGGIRMQQMIQDLLHLSTLSTDIEDLHPINIDSILNEVRQNLEQLIDETEAQIIISSTMPVLCINKSDIIRLFQNLISNAIKFRKKNINPIIVIATEEKETEWQFFIKDNGIGVAPEFTDQIFHVFKRLHSVDEYEGSGIGLSMCKRIVNRHGGKIWVESLLNKGSIFYFTIKKNNL